MAHVVHQEKAQRKWIYIALFVVAHTQGAQAWITVLPITWRELMQWKEDTTAGSRMSTGLSAYDIRTTTTTTTQTIMSELR